MGEWLAANPWAVTTLGLVAGTISTSSFVPQLLKAWREEDTAAISKRTYVMTVSSFTLWTIYGLALGSLPLILFNLLSLALSGAILALKVRGARRRARAGGIGLTAGTTAAAAR